MNREVNNKESLLNINPINLFPMLIFMVLSFGVLVYICSTKTMEDNYQTKGYVTCNTDCYITTILPSNIDFTSMDINKKIVEYEEEQRVLKVDTTNYVSYYEISLKVRGNYTDKEIVDLNFYYNKQRIIKKIFDKIF